MKKSLANQIAKVWNEFHSGHTAEAMTTAIVSEDCVDIVPTATNDGMAFYHVEDFADIMRAFNVTGHITFRTGKFIARLY
jgi:hypothetical protein